MTIKGIMQHPAMRSNKRMAAYLAFTGCLLLGVLFVSGRLVMAYRSAQEVQEKVAGMQQELADWNAKASYLNGLEYRPIEARQLDSIQTSLMMNLQSHKLQLTDFKQSNSGKEASRIYEMGFRGSYADTISFLNDFRAGDALMNIFQLKLHPHEGLIETTLRYKVYVQ